MQETSGTQVTDYSGNARHGTYTGSPSLNQTMRNGTLKGVLFDAVGKYGKLASDSWMNTGSDKFTAEFVSDLTDASNYPQMGGRSDYGATSQWWFRWYFGYKINVMLNTADNTTNELLAGSASTDACHHVAMVYNGATLKIYVDGSEVASEAQTGAITSKTSDLYVGRISYPDFGFIGRLAGFGMYGSALSAARVLAHAQAAGLA